MAYLPGVLPDLRRLRVAGRALLAAAIALVALVAACGPPGRSDVATLSPAALRARLDAGDAPVVLDVRSAVEFAAGHVPGARWIAHTDLPHRLDELGPARDREVVVYCESGGRAARAAAVLRDVGFSRVLQLEGDMAGWRSAGGPVSRP
jgi:rhodanese-related sulfurtransferase